MFQAHLGRWWILVPALLAFPLTAAAAEPEDPPCKAYLVPCNLGSSYSGTFRWVSVVQSPAGKTAEDVTAKVTRGKVRCLGSVEGEGLLTVETGIGTDDDPQQPWYRIAVACPGAGSEPARMNGSEWSTYKQPRKGGIAVLEGSLEEDHPDVDPVNGVTGTIKLTWSLSQAGS